MRIKRIEIIGFKSFCDRTVLNFKNPITAVVGPNGCGKSNIVDAIRWCMGEQSAKHLRGGSMADVIFNGSETRAAAGMSEVSLTFEEVGFSPQMLEVGVGKDDDLGEEDAAGAESALGATDAADATVSADETPAELSEPGEAVEAVPEETAGTAAGAAPDTAPAPDTAADAATEAQAEVEADVPVTAAQDEAAKILEDAPPAIDFSQYSEVTITRRLFRDGTSGYFLNKVPCRLRDVTDFFLGTGVGTKAYAIIEQGRIGMIVSARAADRRSIIEEAAGITKFKTKKRLAERKLEQTKTNLIRVNDIVDELGKRIGSLRRQAQKAERYRRYKTEMRDIEMWIASHRYLELDAQTKVLVGRLSQITKDRDDAKIEFEKQDAGIVAERAELSVEERRLSGLQEAIYELENRVKLGESKIEYQNKEADELEQRVAEAQAEIRSLVQRREEISEELTDAREAYDAVESEAISEEEVLEQRAESLDSAREQYTDAQTRLDSARSDAAQARTDMARAESQEHAISRRTEDATSRLERLEDESDTARSRRAELDKLVRDGEKTLGSVRQLRMDLGNRAAELEARLTSLADETDEAEARVETLRTEVHKRKSRLQSLKEIQEKYEGFARGTRAVMQRADWTSGESKRIRGLVADVVQAPENLEVAVEAALGDQLGGILVESHEFGVEGVNFLKDHSAGRTAFVHASATAPAMIQVEDRTGAPSGEGVMGAMVDLVRCSPSYEPMAQRLLGDYWVVENLDTAVRLYRQGCQKTLVTLDGDICDGRGVVTGGSRDAEGAGVLAQKRELRDLESIVAELEQDLANNTADYVGKKTETQRVSKALDAARKDTHNHDIDILGREKDVSRSRGELDRLRERIAQLDKERTELAESVAEMAIEMATAKELLESAAERTGRYEREQLGLVGAVTEAQTRVEELSRVLTDHKVRVAQLDEKKSALSATVLRLEQSSEELSDRSESQESFIRVSTERVKTLRGNNADLAESLISARDQRRTKAEALEEGRNAYESRVTELTMAEAAVRKLRIKSDERSIEVGELELQRHDLENERHNLVESIADRYRVALRREVGDYHLRPQVGDEQTKRLQELRRLIERMGADINLTAIEEFEEISTRHDFLKAQKIDLESAVDKLEKAISKINRTSRRLFKETFNAINALFQETFPRLFRGGKAYLSLTGDDSTDILDAGVEIMARPPGKKNATVDQLSGGEKALTAVALIFSIFMFKPSPFCLLDEVDAPLDDANVDRYNEIVREMTDRSQFIVITHNKRTMEIADHLYGITMQEPGSSKVVDVDLKQVDNYAA